MSGVDAYAVRIAKMLDLLPWGSADHGITSGQIAGRLAMDGIEVDPNTVLRDLKSLQRFFALVRTRADSGEWLWKRPGRQVSLSGSLRVQEYVGDPLEDALGKNETGGLDEHDIPDWGSDIEFRR